MNQRNVEAIARLLEGVPQRLAHRFDERVLAEWLAERGLLVPEALTDDEVDLAVDSGASEFDIIVRETHEIRAMLTKIAKGET